MEKKKITEILDMSLERFLMIYDEAPSAGRTTRILNYLYNSSIFDDVKNEPTVRNYLTHPRRDWERVRSLGNKTITLVEDKLKPFGLRLGMTKAEIAAVENETTEAPTLSFQDYINTLKHLADNAGACAVANEFITEDGYKVTFSVEKIKKDNQ